MKKKTLLLTLIFLAVFSICQTAGSDAKQYIKDGLSYGSVLGTAIAVMLSLERNKSILLAIIHGLFNWIYVVYFALTRE